MTMRLHAVIAAVAHMFYSIAMKFLALSGSTRHASTNTAMLRAVAAIAYPAHDIKVFSHIGDFPVFSPDLEALPLPAALETFVAAINRCDGIIISSPEYVRAIPGGLKNAIDWLVSRPEIVGKPIVLMHASHRGDDMLAQLRMVLSTVSDRFSAELFLRFELIKKSPDEIRSHLEKPENTWVIEGFLADFARHCLL